MKVVTDKQNISPLPAGYTARRGTVEDHKIVFDLLNMHSQYMNACDDLTDPEILRLDWLNTGFNPENDVRLVFEADGQLVAFVECWLNQEPPVHPWIFGCVHPAHWGRGLGAHMVTWAEDHARQALEKCAPELRVAPRSGAEAHNKKALALFEGLGWKHIRSFYRMVTDLDSQPEVPPTPEGITIRPYDPETELEAVYRTVVDSFQDHFGFIAPPYEKGLADFKHNFLEDPAYDPRFWFVAHDGKEIVGISICRREDPEDSESGWVNELGVVRHWRKRGLGYTLLKHSFAAFYADGKQRAGLGVDATNLTGALRLYERAGMHVQRQFNQYEKEFRPGRELAVESLETTKST
ncbi:MAG TPA: GNAT family N-acetyltransferase [Anaerolineales bacterium]|nr:GNAT family N-acetyltransferase [Anaerolineales bacterium]